MRLNIPEVWQNALPHTRFTASGDNGACPSLP